jgi:hypothetical protein
MVEESQDFLIGRLREITVPVPNGGKALRRAGADDLVGQLSKLAARLRQTDGDRDYNPRRRLRAGGFNGRSHCRSGGQPVVDEDYDTICQLDRFVAVAIGTFPSLELSLFLSRHLFNHNLRNPVPRQDVIVQNTNTAGCDGTHRQLGMPGKAQLPYQEHIKGCIERVSDFECDRYTTAGQREHHEVISALQVSETRRQLNTRMATIFVGVAFIRFRGHVESPAFANTHISKQRASASHMPRHGTSVASISDQAG